MKSNLSFYIHSIHWCIDLYCSKNPIEIFFSQLFDRNQNSHCGRGKKILSQIWFWQGSIYKKSANKKLIKKDFEKKKLEIIDQWLVSIETLKSDSANWIITQSPSASFIVSDKKNNKKFSSTSIFEIKTVEEF